MNSQMLTQLAHEIDGEHRVLHSYLEDFANLPAPGDVGMARVEACVAEFTAFVETHFRHEEEVMTGFVGTALDGAFASHRASHADLLSRIADAVQREPVPHLLDTLREIVGHWLSVHLDVHDRLLLSCLSIRMPGGLRHSTAAGAAAGG
jgi:hemerythrin-like metal-binding protein